MKTIFVVVAMVMVSFSAKANTKTDYNTMCSKIAPYFVSAINNKTELKLYQIKVKRIKAHLLHFYHDRDAIACALSVKLSTGKTQMYIGIEFPAEVKPTHQNIFRAVLAPPNYLK